MRSVSSAQRTRLASRLVTLSIACGACAAVLALTAGDAVAGGAEVSIQIQGGGFVVNLVPSSVPFTLQAAGSQPLSGCYTVVASGLPPGLHVTPNQVCAGNKGAAPSLAIAGTPTLPLSAPVQPASVALTVYQSSSGRASGSSLGTTTFTLPILPNPSQPSWSNSYANSTLSSVSCPAVGDCWVVGTSSNPAANPNPGISGDTPRMVTVQGATPAQHLQVPEGGLFIADLVRVSPLDLRFVRTNIPDTINAFSCYAVDECIAVGSTNVGGAAQPFALVMTNDGAAWHAYTGSVGQASTGSFQAVDCPTAQSCIAVGSLGRLGQQKTTGFSEPLSVGRTPFFGQMTQAPTTRFLGGVSCVDSSTCLATGGAAITGGPTGDGRIEITHDFGVSWSSDQISTDDPACQHSCTPVLQPWFRLVTDDITFGGLSSISCVRNTYYYCATAWPFLGKVADTTDGRSWLVGGITQAPYGISSNVSNPLSCPATNHCFAIDSPLIVCGNDFACTHAGVLESLAATYDEQTYGGAEWGLAGFGPPGVDNPVLSGIACPGIDSCVEVGKWQPHGQAAWSPTFPLVMGTQAAENPYFVPPNLSESNWTADLSLVLGFVSAGLGILAPFVAPEFIPLALFLGLAGIVSGGQACFGQGDALACAGTGLGVVGLYPFTHYPIVLILSLLGLGTTVADPASYPTSPSPLPPWVTDPQVPDGGPADE